MTAGPAPETPQQPALRLDGVAKSYDEGKTFAVRDLSLETARGEFIALVGGSGSGKTTTLKLINRLIEPTSGEIWIDGARANEIEPHLLRRHIGYVFQGIGLFPHMSVAENIAIGPQLLGWDKADIDARVDELLDLVELSPALYAHREPHALSGGQRQRVGFARALAARPSIVLMDEPFGALDPLTRDVLARAYLRLHASLGLTTVMVTHDLNEALLLADRLGVMRDGRLVALGDPLDLYNGETDPYVRDLLATPRLQAARIAEKLDGRAT